MLANNTIAIREVQTFDIQRKVVAHVTSSSWENVPHVTYIYEPDITDFYGSFKTLAAEHSKRATEPHKITFNTIMLKAITEGLLAAPKLNALLEYNPKNANGRLLICADVNISLPWVLLDGRMITPIVAKTNNLSLDAISDAIATLARKIERTNIDELLQEVASAVMVEKLKKLHLGILQHVLIPAFARLNTMRLSGDERKRYYNLPVDLRLTKNDIMNGTVTISNIGSLYHEQRGYFGLLEVVSPQVLAIGIGAIQEKPGIFVDHLHNRQIGIRKILPMCLAFDHRALDFAALVPFMKRMDEIFAYPEEVFTW